MNDEILLYRGIAKPKKGDTIGRWWSTDPYYALHYAHNHEEFYVAKIKKADIHKLAKDASIEAEFQNYYFESDPPTAKKATQEEVKKLLSHAVIEKGIGPGGPRIKHPDDAIEIGMEIFGNKRKKQYANQ